jgi:tripeptidyl-peptidase-1
MTATPLVWVHSLSYGNDEVQQTSDAYMQSTNIQFQVAGSLGLSLLAASGDQGVWGRSGKGNVFHPDFPASSPYITAVGGTDFATKSVIGEETAWSCGGGGFSDAFAMPSWQADAVAASFATATAAGALPEASYYNATGRGYPDVSALGGQVNPYCVSVKGGAKFKGVAGTSASCPVVAGLIAQLNNVRLAADKPVLGWLNPFLYENAQCFNDVNDGSQNNCEARTTGFSALNGWDAATGLGTPNYGCLAAVALN